MYSPPTRKNKKNKKKKQQTNKQNNRWTHERFRINYVMTRKCTYVLTHTHTHAFLAYIFIHTNEALDVCFNYTHTDSRGRLHTDNIYIICRKIDNKVIRVEGEIY